ncbi:MAG: MG2 domain-containing protein, partial [Planctomycetota bacterium]|nr:MG2 domain-containing protein [Planctomycetota bacterium]
MSKSLTVAACLLLLQIDAPRPIANAQEAKAQNAKTVVKAPAITSLPDIPGEVHDALGARKFEATVKLIDGLLKKNPKSTATGYLLYLKGRALTELERFDEAIATFGQIEKLANAPGDASWVHRARFGRADVLVRQRNYQAASVIYRAAADRLLSENRRDELAGIYLEFANRYFDGIQANDPSAERRPDYQQAMNYYLESRKIKPSLKVLHVVDSRLASCRFELKQYKQAVDRLTDYLNSYANKDAAEKRCTPQQETVARYELGRAQLAVGHRERARAVWRDFVDNSGPRGHAGELLAKAAFGLASTYGVPQPENDVDLELGVASHEKFLARFAEHKLATKAKLEIARSYAHRGRNDDAIRRLQFIISFKADKDTESIASARFLISELFRSQKKFREAISGWREFLNEHPTDQRWAQAQRLLIDTELDEAADARARKDYVTARKLWSTFLNKYPLDSRVPSIQFHFGQMNYAAALDAKRKADSSNDADAKQLKLDAAKLFGESIADWKRLVSKYPNHVAASHAQIMIGITLEDQLLKLADALDAYKKVKGTYAGQAKTRIDNLTAKRLEVVTERKFRSNETAKIKVSTRNIQDLSIKIYRIDMQDYFRKMHLARGVESLDIALIDPDKQWDHKVAGFEEYRQLENEITIPLNEPGVAAVTVSSDKLEATTMVVVSDLDMIVKCSRNELFVFVQDMVKQQPADATLLLSDGSEVFATEKTSKDGIVQKSFEQLKSIKDLRVFAIGDGHSASTVSDLNGSDFAVGPSPKGFLFTERPAYRAGQMVNVKGIIRWVNEDRYTFKEGAAFKLDVFDPRGRVVHTGQVKLNGFGTFFDHFALPDASPQGTYRIHAHDAASKQSYESSFEVHEYKLEPIQLTVDLKRNVYFRGEKIEGTIKLAYYYGTPLADRRIQYHMLDGQVYHGQTDAKGELKFSFDTQQYRESQQLVLQVSFAERNLETEKGTYLATRGFEISVSTLRDVYVAGETFDVESVVTDPSGEPLATDLKLEVLEQTTVNGKTGERLVASHPLKSDKDSGKARQTLRIDNAGRFIVRVSGTDQFGNQVSSSHTLRISGDDDSVRLRILADRHEYNVGETANVQLHWRNKPALALVTFEGARILGHRLVQLTTGANKLSVELVSHFAPNFQLAVAVTDGHSFHQAQSEFRLNRQLHIALKPNKHSLAPGDEISVDMVVTDAEGKPVSAELSLGLIQKNLLERYPSQQDEIAEFFGQGEREWSLRTAASSTFSYRPATHNINEFILAETNRQDVERMEASGLANLSEAQKTQTAKRLLARAREELGNGRVDNARKLAEQAKSLQVRYGSFDDRLESVTHDAMRAAGANPPILNKIPYVSTGTDSSTELPAYVNRFNQLMKDHRFAEASRVAKEAEESEPTYPITQTMKWKAAFARRVGGNEGLRDLKESAFLEVLDEVEESAIPLFGKPTPSPRDKAPSHQLKELEKLIRETTRRGKADNWQDLNGSGEIQNFDTTLSLVISQTQHLHGQSQAALADIDKFDGTLLAVNPQGEVQVVNGLGVERLTALAKSGSRLMPKQGAAETGFWDPVIATDKNGKATVKFRLPERSTAWTLQSTGINAETLAGHAEVEIITKKELFAELKTPMAFTHGDDADVLVEVHNSTVKKGQPITVTCKATFPDVRTVELTKTLMSPGPGIQEVVFPFEIRKSESVQFEVTIVSGKLKDVLHRELRVRPYGLEVFATASGTAAQNTIAFVEHDKKLPAQDPKLEILIGPSIDRSLLDTVLGSDVLMCGGQFANPSSGLERAISDVLGGVPLLALVRKSRTADSPKSQALAGRIQSAVLQLVSSQRDDGGWNWSGSTGKKHDALITSRIVRALSSARRAGFAVPEDTLTKAVTTLKTAYAKSDQTDREGHAIILHGPAEASAADFAFANRLYRERNSLSASGLLHLASTLTRLERNEMAGELLKLVGRVSRPVPKTPNDPERDGPGDPSYVSIPWMQSNVELEALHLLAMAAVSPADAKLPELADSLMAARIGSRRSTEKANGPAIAALAGWFGRAKHANEKYKLSVYVNKKLIQTIDIDPSADPSQRLEVPTKLLVEGKPQQINFDIEGRGRFSYSAVLRGFVPTDRLKNTTDDWRVTRTYEPAQRSLDEQPIPRGFEILTGNYKTFRNPLTQLPVGERGEVTLHVYRQGITGQRNERFDYLVITEPVPAGAMVLTESITGSFERYELAPGAITFYVGDEAHPGEIRYSLVGYLPGKYRTVQTLVRSFYRPDKIAITEPKSLDVLARGEQTKDTYKLTPVELYRIGLGHFNKSDHATAFEHLSTLFRTYRLDAKHYPHVVQLLFLSALELNRSTPIVEYFEIIKERFPGVDVSFESILKVASAYRELGEYERSYLVYRATVESAFERESQIAGFLDARGEFVRSVQVLERLLQEYPAESYVAMATYALAQEVYGKAREAAADKKLRDAGISRVHLIATSVKLLDHFVSTWPKDPTTDQASFSLVSALLDLQQFKAAIDRSEKFAERYADSKLLDSFWYVIGYSHFALGEHEKSLAMCRKVAQFKYTHPDTKAETDAQNKWESIYIMGQVFHSLGKAAEAIVQYKQVKDRFADAVEAIDFFTRKSIELPEVTTVTPGDGADVKLSFRNVAKVNTKVYRIDLLKFGLMQRSLNRITAINLAGIRPYHEQNLTLGDGQDYRDRDQPVKLPLKDEGAYLVVCQGENLYTSGLVLVTPLELEVQEDAAAGRMRVTVKNAMTKSYTRDVHV